MRFSCCSAVGFVSLFAVLAGCSGGETEESSQGAEGAGAAANADADPSTSGDSSQSEASGGASVGGAASGAESGGADSSGTESGGADSSGGSSASGGESNGAGGMPSGAGLGETCSDSDDCSAGECLDGVCLTTAEGCLVENVEQSPGGNWEDSYSVDGKCYCATTFDHAIGDIVVDTPVGERTVRQICDAIGPGPGKEGNPVYNDIQCGNGPANDAGDEDYCPGRVDQGDGGCCTVGPRWDLTVLQP